MGGIKGLECDVVSIDTAKTRGFSYVGGEDGGGGSFFKRSLQRRVRGEEIEGVGVQHQRDLAVANDVMCERARDVGLAESTAKHDGISAS